MIIFKGGFRKGSVDDSQANCALKIRCVDFNPFHLLALGLMGLKNLCKVSTFKPV